MYVISATIYGDRRYEGLWDQRKGPGVFPSVSRSRFGTLERLSGLVGRSLCHWDAAREARREPKGVATRPEWPRGRFQEARLRERSERLLGWIWGYFFN